MQSRAQRSATRTVPGRHNIQTSEDNADSIFYSDAFAGGFCAGMVEGKSLEECVSMGQWLAKLSIQELGPS